MKRSPVSKRIDVTGILKRPTLYIDVDDTIIACVFDGSGFDLRPSIMTQLRVLKELYNVRWLTCWGPEPLKKLIDSLYGQDIWRDTEYCNWMHRTTSAKNEKVDAVLEGPEDWYWLEDPLYGDDLLRLREAGLESRYIQVNPREVWAFADACKKLFALTGVDSKRLIEVGAKMEWFERF